MPSLQELLGFVPLMRALQTVPSGVPRILPDAAYAPKQQVLGDKARQFRYRGTRKAARVVPYGAPPRRVQLLGRSVRDVGMLFVHEEVQFTQELVLQLIDWVATDGKGLQATTMARSEVLQQTEDFKTRLDTFRTVAVHSQVVGGVTYLDVDGNILPTSSGAITAIDSGVKASHKGQINPGGGGLVSASWASSSTDIPTQIGNILQYLLIEGGRPITTAVYGANIPGYVANNDKAKYWLARNAGLQQKFADSPMWLPDGLFGIQKWIPALAMYHEADDGTVVQPFPADQITLCPGFETDAWMVAEGSFPVPTANAFQPATSIEEALKGLVMQYGQFQWSKLDLTNIPSSTFTHGDTFLPWWNAPDSVAFVDTTP